MSHDELLLQVQMSGFCVLKDVIPKAECVTIRQRVLDAVARESANYPDAPKQVGFVPGIINHEQSFAPYLADERMMKLAGALLGDQLRISFTSAIINQPGNARGAWHADWPFNQRNAGHVPVPYPDAVFHLTTLWMLSPFGGDNGGTLIVPGSHRSSSNPTDGNTFPSETPFPTEQHAHGEAGSVLVFDSRLWHAASPNRTDEPRVALAVRYAPWWLNLEILRPESDERRRMVDETGGGENHVPSLPRAVYDRLPSNVQPLYRHWIARA
jgi:hypothetical protein